MYSNIIQKPSLRAFYLITIFSTFIVTMITGQQITVILENQNSRDVLSQDSDVESMYNIVLYNDSKVPVNLAGQNYRLYYDSDAAMLKEKSIKSLLPSQYSSLNLVQHYFDTDATGYGVLPYENHMGFINLAVDYNMSAGGSLIIKPGARVRVGELQFSLFGDKDPKFVWAKDNLTHTYATAFVELARVENGRLKKLDISGLKIEDRASTTSLSDTEVIGMEYFPNPFKDQLEIKFNYPLANDAQLEVTDIFGSLLYSESLKAGTDHLNLKGNDLPAGALLIKVRQGEDVATFKAIKTK